MLCGSCFEKKNVCNKFSPRGLFRFVIISQIVNYIPDRLRGHLHQLMAIIYTIKKCGTGPQIAASTCTTPNPIKLYSRDYARNFILRTPYRVSHHYSIRALIVEPQDLSYTQDAILYAMAYMRRSSVFVCNVCKYTPSDRPPRTTRSGVVVNKRTGIPEGKIISNQKGSSAPKAYFD